MSDHSLNVRAMYFSGTGTTEKIAVTIAQAVYASLADTEDVAAHPVPDSGIALCRDDDIDFTPPAAREKIYSFGPEDIVVFGVPTIAGRVPNVLLPFLDTLEGGGAIGIPVVLYGNRNFDDSLIELRDILEGRGFHTIAAAAFIGEHSFSRKLAAGRPDEEDIEDAERFGDWAADKIGSVMTAVSKVGDTLDKLEGAFDRVEKSPGRSEVDEDHGEGSFLGTLDGNSSIRDALLGRMCPVKVRGEEPLRPYYRPRDRKGNFIDILKVKPKLDEEKCTKCGICVDACPMGSIKPEAPGIVDGICIKCCGCEKKCPEGALYFDDPGYIYHKEELEAQYTERREPELFL